MRIHVPSVLFSNVNVLVPWPRLMIHTKLVSLVECMYTSCHLALISAAQHNGNGTSGYALAVRCATNAGKYYGIKGQIAAHIHKYTCQYVFQECDTAA